MRSRRTEGLVQSEIRAMTQACNAIGGVNLGQGICDVPTPEVVKQAAIDAVTTNRSIYTRFDGLVELREALSHKVRHFNKIEADPESEIVVTLGSAGAFVCTLTALFDPGDELIIFEPFYGYHVNAAEVAGIVPKFVRLEAPDFAIDYDALKAAIGPRTKGILVNTPTNPCGKVYTREELTALAEICMERDLLCITDEVYEYVLYEGREHVSMATIPGMKERTVTMTSYSKTFSITGWRIGYACAAPELAQAIGLVNDLNYICAPHPLQLAVAHGIRTLPDTYYSDMCTAYEAKRNQFCDVLKQVGLNPVVPDGAYYVLADVSSLGEPTAKAAAMRLLSEAKVAGVPGSAFFSGNDGQEYVRFCYAKQPVDLERAMDNLLRWRG